MAGPDALYLHGGPTPGAPTLTDFVLSKGDLVPTCFATHVHGRLLPTLQIMPERNAKLRSTGEFGARKYRRPPNGVTRFFDR